MIHHRQSSEYTTAASSLLSILHIQKGTPLTKENEFAIWHASANLPTRGCNIYGLALYAKQQGLSPKVIVETKEYDFPDYRFYRYTKDDITHAAFSSALHLAKAEAANIPITQKRLSLADVKQHLQDNMVLLRVNAKPIRNAKRNTSNYIVVLGYEEGYFHIMDPAIGGLSIPKDVMQDAFDSLETKKYRDHRMILFQE
ncbi:TPA: hypothetical protein HA278_02770 [Candidatus Woesearchaeota archaeon]|nr:hypothetical protein [archaeon]HIJ10956.1 hypothetical protein [Candidatus Woesearchaeota archaeon]|tara:strand:- start:69 stop:665 length:597 start_codon:yes stop_codon:yes gene_type:complete